MRVEPARMNDPARRLDNQRDAAELARGSCRRRPAPDPGGPTDRSLPGREAAGLDRGAHRQAMGSLGVGVVASRLEEPSRGRRSAGTRTARRDSRLRPYAGRGLRRLPRAAAGGPPPLASRCAPSRRSSMRCFPTPGPDPDGGTSASVACGRRLAADPRLRRGGPARPRGHGRRLQGPAPAGSTASSPSRCSSPAPTPGRTSGRGSSAKPRRWRACTTPTSSRSTMWATTRGARTSRWSSSRGAAWPRPWRARRSRPARRRRCWPRWPRPCRRRTRPGSCTATSSRPTSCSPPTARPRSPISGWRGTSTESRP